MPNKTRPIQRALLSVFDKTGLVELAQALRARGVSLISTGGSRAALMAAESMCLIFLKSRAFRK